ncbi:hypothetical protein HZ994_00280 [Akkermansiaceae bacterium]|nr:hypothetical protein HZ994_00280 [Akkermansiaceae bacterium]
MNPLKLLLLLAACCHTASAQKLSNSDREALLERLEKISEEASSKVDARFRTAISAYRSAMASDDAAMDLYLKCEEKVNFEEMQKKGADFREWKKRNAEVFSDKDFREALRQQLRWLVLTLEAASEDPDRDKLAAEASRVLESIVSQAEDFTKHRNVLQQPGTGSVFARAYDINGVKAEQWPPSPIPIAAVYEQVILPPLRRSDRLASLSDAWKKRMVQESTLLDTWDSSGDGKGKAGQQGPAYVKFVSETLPRLRWDAEKDLFRYGDERGAALRMLAHIQENLTHEDAPKWTDEFKSLLQAAPAEGAP